MASFKSSFAAARKAGKKEFTWNGKRYNTKLASDTPKSTPTPTPRPSDRPSDRPSANSGASRSTKGKVEAHKVKKVADATRRHIARSGASRSTSGKTGNSLSGGSLFGGFIKWGDRVKKSRK